MPRFEFPADSFQIGTREQLLLAHFLGSSSFYQGAVRLRINWIILNNLKRKPSCKTFVKQEFGNKKMVH